MEALADENARLRAALEDLAGKAPDARGGLADYDEDDTPHCAFPALACFDAPAFLQPAPPASGED